MLNLNPLVSTLYFLQMFRTAFLHRNFQLEKLTDIFATTIHVPFHYTTIHPGSQRFPADGNHPCLCGEKSKKDKD